MGIPRVLEALESNEWDSFATADEDEEIAALEGGTDQENEVELDPENMDFGFDKADFEGLRKAIWEAQVERSGVDDGEDETADKASSKAKLPSDGPADGKDEDGDELGDEDIQKVEEMMRKLQAVRDMSAGLPEDQKKRIAARAVGEVMKEL